MTGINEGVYELSNLFKYDVFHTIPKYQRQFDWTSKEAAALWDDLSRYINDCKNDPRAKYLFGQIISYRTKDGYNYVIDGQQRLITTTIFISVAKDLINIIWHDKNDNSAKTIKSSEALRIFNEFLYSAVDKKLRITPTNIANSEALLNIVNGQISKIDLKGAPLSVKNMAGVYKLFFEKFCNLLKINPSEIDKIKNQFDLVNILTNHVSKLMSFTIAYINTYSLRDAYRTFDAVNSRGIKLTPVDLIKNHIYANCYYDDEDLAADKLKIEDRWEKIRLIFGTKAIRMFRYQAITKCGLVRNTDLYEKVMSELKTSNEIELFMTELETSLPLFSTVFGEFLCFKKVSINRTLKNLNSQGFHMFYPIILSIFLKNKKEKKDERIEPEIDYILKPLEVIFIRNIMIRKGRTGDFEEDFANYANKLYTGQMSLEEVAEKIYEKTDLDNIFEENLKSHKWTNDQARYVLSELYNRRKGALSVITENVDLEHIMPTVENFDTFSRQWPHITEEEKLLNQDLLGNLLLLRNSINRSIQESSFSIKRERYPESEILDVDPFNILELGEWTISNIEERTIRLSKEIIKTWKISN